MSEPSPGLEEIETAIGKDIVPNIIEFIEKNASPHRAGTQGKG